MTKRYSDLELITAAGFKGSNFDQFLCIKFGAHEMRIGLSGENGALLSNAAAFNVLAEGRIDGQEKSFEFTTMDARDIVAFVMHFNYSASARNSIMSTDALRLGMTSFEFKGEKVALPFFKEDEHSWLGFEREDTLILQNPATYYGDRYLRWREEVCEKTLATFDQDPTEENYAPRI